MSTEHTYIRQCSGWPGGKQNTHSDTFHQYYREPFQHCDESVVNTEHLEERRLTQRRHGLFRSSHSSIHPLTRIYLQSAALDAHMQQGNKDVSVFGLLETNVLFPQGELTPWALHRGVR